jgi:hypothetical protein
VRERNEWENNAESAGVRVWTAIIAMSELSTLHHEWVPIEHGTTSRCVRRFRGMNTDGALLNPEKNIDSK